jgi:hypothetical protein
MIRLRGNAACHTPPPVGRTARQREGDADDARWAMQIMTMARHETRTIEPPVAASPAPIRTILDIVSKVKRHDMLLIPRVLPIAAGSESEDLLCGRCAGLVASGTSRKSLRQLHPEGDNLIARCTCKALNLLCSVAGVHSGYRRTG